MPIERVPVVHKFGIISHSQRLELQERLLKQSYLANLQSKKPTTKYVEFTTFNTILKKNHFPEPLTPELIYCRVPEGRGLH